VNAVFEAATRVATPLAAFAFLATLAVFWHLRVAGRRSTEIASVPEADRAHLVDESLVKYGLRADGLTKAQRYDLLKDELARRFGRSRLYAILGAVVTVICFALALFTPQQAGATRVVLVSFDATTFAMIGHRAPAGSLRALYQIQVQEDGWRDLEREGILFAGADQPPPTLLQRRSSATGLAIDSVPRFVDRALPRGALAAKLRAWKADASAYRDCPGESHLEEGNDLWLIDASSLCSP